MSESGAPVGETLEQLVGRFLRTVPETWTEYDTAALSEMQEQALYLLTTAGMIERRVTFRLRLSGHPLAVEATITCTGEGGLIQALEYVLADTWNDWRETFEERKAGDLKDAPMFHCQRIGKEQWRLTADGVQARHELGAGQPSIVFDFVLKRGFFNGQPHLLPDGRISQRLPVGGKGNLERMQKVRPDACPAEVNITNWHEGAQAFAVAFTELLKTRERQAAAPAKPAAPQPGERNTTPEAPADPVEATVKTLGKAVRQIELVKFLASRENRSAELTTVAKDFYKRQRSDKQTLKIVRRQAERARENLGRKGCPLQIHISGNVVRLIDADPVA
jgi:hypothetical protein